MASSVATRSAPPARPPRRCVFWVEFVSPHMGALLRALAQQGVEVTVVVLGEVGADRLQLGWSGAAHGSGIDGIQVIDPLAGEALLRDRAGGLIHLTEGLGGNAVVRPGVERVRRSGCHWGVMAEAVDRRGIAGMLRWPLYLWRFRLAGRRPDFVLAIGADAVGWMRTTSGLARRVHPFAYFLPASGDVAAGSRDAHDLPRLIYVGQLITRKRVDLLLQGCARLCRGRASLHIVGEGPEEPALRELAQALRIADAVTFHGAVSMSEVRTFLAAADCLVLPSDHDGWGAVASEALLSGVPVIVSSAVGAREVVQCSGTGGVFQAGDAAALENLLERQLQGGRETAEQRRQLAQWARSCLSGEAGATYLQQLLDACCDGRPAPPAPWVAQSRARTTHAGTC